MLSIGCTVYVLRNINSKFKISCRLYNLYSRVIAANLFFHSFVKFWYLFEYFTAFEFLAHLLIYFNISFTFWCILYVHSIKISLCLFVPVLMVKNHSWPICTHTQNTLHRNVVSMRVLCMKSLSVIFNWWFSAHHPPK